MEQTIELDCAPGNPRPGDLIEQVCEGLELTIPETSSRVFGNWTWDFSHISEARWKEIQPILKERITKLYNSGIIRYGSW